MNTLGHLMEVLKFLLLHPLMWFRFLTLILLDPKEAFVAALSSCHMLFFLGIAAKKKFIVERYIGIMDKNEDGKLAITTVYLCPKVTFIGDYLPTKNQIEEMHQQAHHSCFLANSVKADITVKFER